MPHTRARPTSRLLATLVIPALVVAAAALADIAPALAGGPAHRAATSGAHHARACRARSARSRSAAKGSRSRSRKLACRHRGARAARRRSVAAPVLSAQGQTLSWTSVYTGTSYVLATIRHPDTTPDTTYSVVSGTSVTPPAVPGETLKYGVRANVDGAPRGNEVAITYPAPPPPPPDTTAPDTTITSGPAATTTSASASFAFTGTDNVTPAASITFRCQLDGGAWAACGSPKAYSNLAVGSHTFNVRAVDGAGNVDQSPATQTWTLNASAPVLSVSGNTISWSAIPGVTDYTLATIHNPSTTRDTTYSNTGNVTSITPPASPGETVKYGLAANVPGALWAQEVSITYPAAPVPSSSMVVGLGSGAWGITGAQDVASAFQYIRWDSSDAEPLSDYTGQGLKAIVVFSGPYNTRGVSALDPAAWATDTVNWYQSNCGGSSATCPAIEVLNEPAGSWFWGANALSAANANAYANLVKATYNAFHTRYGASSPKILANTFEGGGCSSGSGPSCTTQWWSWISAGAPDIGSYYDGVVMHPYGGGDGYSSTLSAQGNRDGVTSAHTTTGKPVWVTEIGWPTAVGQPSTGDSQQWTETQQAANIYNFVTWSRSTGYVDGILYFNYRDYGTNNWYGVERSDGSKKPGWTALSQAAQQQPCTVCG